LENIQDLRGVNVLDEKEFFDEFMVKEIFEASDLQWKTLSDIYDDYSHKQKFYDEICDEIIKHIKKDMTIEIQSINGRSKDPKHLVEKIIRKRGKEQNHKYAGINVCNYEHIIKDLVGVRILTLSKEDWEKVHDWLMQKFNPDIHSDAEIRMDEEPQAYTRYGDRDIFHGKIRQEHSNKGYRSQHYVVFYKSVYCEIQVRTLAEEVFGEFDHKVRYPYRDENNFLKRYTGIVSQFMNSVDELISTCFQMQETGWDTNNNYFTDEHYIDWKNTSKEKFQATIKKTSTKEEDLLQAANNIITRKGDNNER